ncbi:hypothetical protein EX895_003731 [Sporisorium graminicola]|uniref:Peptidase A1 domain-containing protein n=1 Tax=Sporisorium graminicola TaxID=280036 RepID=A0A4U7KRG8_9BASI|nr:hypothetical protein EX895_003731 [Sporisorium graminicola]TKY87054.1 hypothetical protein EX895_003731 [Sporisorium graminicola]
MTTSTSEPRLLATRLTLLFPLLLLLLLLLLLSLCCDATLIRRDEHAIVIPLTYAPKSDLFTATISIGSSGSTYNLIVDTGSPFLALQNALFHPSPSTYDPQNKGQPDMGGGGGYMFTTPDADKKEERPKMHFVVDSAWLVEASGVRAGAGAKAGNVTVGLTQLDDLNEAQGILGLSPPFSLVGGASVGGKSGKSKRDASAPPPPSAVGKEGAPPAQQAGKLPSLDVSFLHSYLSSESRKTLGMIGSSHFYLDFTPSTILNPVPTGELVFPLTGTMLPTTTSGYNYSGAITIDPSSGSTYPSHPFWGIAHRSDLRFVLGDAVLEDVRIDAVLLDSGTSGIIAPPSEVEKIFAATRDRIAISAGREGEGKAVLGKARCSEDLRMGFELGAGNRALFESVRRTAQPDGRFVETKHDAEGWGKRGLYDGLVVWKSYADTVSNSIHGLLHGLSDWLHLFPPADADGAAIAKRHLRSHKLLRRVPLLRVGVDLLPPSSAPPAAQDNASGAAEPDEKNCQVSLIGSPQVEAMFPSNGPNFKVWILGLEFFQSNLIYHNLDTAQTVVVPRNSPS